MFDWKQFASHSLFGVIRLSQQTSKTSEPSQVKSSQSIKSIYSIAICKKKPLVSGVHPPGICHNRFLQEPKGSWFLYLLLIKHLLQRYAGGRGYVFAIQYSVGAAIFDGLWRHFKPIVSLTTTRIFKLGKILASLTDVLFARQAGGKKRVTKP